MWYCDTMIHTVLIIFLNLFWPPLPSGPSASPQPLPRTAICIFQPVSLTTNSKMWLISINLSWKKWIMRKSSKHSPQLPIGLSNGPNWRYRRRKHQYYDCSFSQDHFFWFRNLSLYSRSTVPCTTVCQCTTLLHFWWQPVRLWVCYSKQKYSELRTSPWPLARLGTLPIGPHIIPQWILRFTHTVPH